jgi:hypothetical protein
MEKTFKDYLKEASTNEAEVEVSDEMRGKIDQWIDKFSKYKGGNGDTLPEGYMQWALNSGIATDFYEQNEVQAFNKMKGYDADSNDGEWSDGDHDDFTGNESGASPITTACLVELNKITGDDFIEDNAHIIDAVMHGDGNESTQLSGVQTEDTNNELLGDLESGLENAKAGNDMSDFIADEIGDYIRAGIEDMGEEAWQDSIEGKALAELDPVDTPEEQAKAFQNAINVLKGGNESTELDRIKELAGASIDETYDDDDDFYEAYGELWWNEDEIMDEAEYQGRKVKLGKPMQGDVKKFKVYVKDPKTGNTKKVNFGHGGSSVKGKAMSIKKSNPARRKSFRARHNCDNPGPRTKARYWSCRKW